jgi:hypothetical protein
MSWKIDEETWKMLGQSIWYKTGDPKMSVPAVTQSPPATLCPSFPDKTLTPVLAVCNTSVT